MRQYWDSIETVLHKWSKVVPSKKHVGRRLPGLLDQWHICISKVSHLAEIIWYLMTWWCCSQPVVGGPCPLTSWLAAPPPGLRHLLPLAGSHLLPHLSPRGNHSQLTAPQVQNELGTSWLRRFYNRTRPDQTKNMSAPLHPTTIISRLRANKGASNIVCYL